MDNKEDRNITGRESEYVTKNGVRKRIMRPNIGEKRGREE